MTRIMTNVAAINAQRNLQQTSIRMGRTLEKLSSGYRINRAADDAAGLGISEKMRAQIRGNKQALRNVQDGISMLQTAEGAMDEVHSMLQRIRELAVQAANGTYGDNGPERTSIGQEIVQLANEIDRIALSTEFNGQKLLTGNLSVTLGGSAATNLVANEVIVGPTDTSVAASDLVAGDALSLGAVAGAVTLPATMAPGNYNFGINGSNIELRMGTTVIATANTLNFNGGAPVAIGGSGTLTFSNGLTVAIDNTAGTAVYDFARLQTDLTAAANDSLVVNGVQATQVAVSQAKPQNYTLSTAGAGSLTLTGADGSTQTLTGLTDLTGNESRTFSFSQLGVSLTVQAGPSGATIANVISSLTSAGNATIAASGSGPSSTLQVGANVPDTLAITFTNLQTAGLGGGGFFLGGPSGLTSLGASGVVATITAAHNVMTAVDGAIQVLNTQRGTLGAAQNRLEHSVRSLGVAVENLSASESRIRDADIAELSSEMVSAQILQSAGVSVLAQANQTPQSILQLLQQ